MRTTQETKEDRKKQLNINGLDNTPQKTFAMWWFLAKITDFALLNVGWGVYYCSMSVKLDTPLNKGYIL